MQGSITQSSDRALWSSSVARRNWLWTCLVLTVVTAPFAIAVATGDPAAPLAAAASITWLHFAMIVLIAGALFLARWRLLDETASGWIATSLLVIGLCLMPFALDIVASREIATPPTGVPEMVTVVLVAWFLRAAVAGVEPVGWLHPFTLGAAAGSAVTVLHRFDLSESIRQDAAPLLTAVLAFFGLVIVVSILRLPAFTAGTRLALAAMIAVGTGWHHLVPFQLLSDQTARALILALSGITSLLLLSVAVVLMQQAVAQHDQRLVTLADRASLAEQSHGHDEELLHELRATVAGIASASRLLDQSPAQMVGGRSDGLHKMLASEVARLEKLLQRDVPEIAEPPELLDLDALIEPLVVGLATQGARIEHRHSGLTVQGRAHGISEVVHTLLTNANRHAPAARVVVSSELSGSHVVLRVADNGPGVAPEVRPSLFQREAKGPTSPGQGLGLYIAQRTIRDQGGELWLEESHQGAVFSLRLPQTERT